MGKVFDYYIDGRMIHVFTLHLLEKHQYQKMVCFSDDIANDFEKQKTLLSIVNNRCIVKFCNVNEKIEDKEPKNTMIIFDSFMALEKFIMVNSDILIDEVKIIYVSQLKRETKRYCSGIYLSDKDISLVEDLKAQGVKLMCCNQEETIMLSDLIEANNAY